MRIVVFMRFALLIWLCLLSAVWSTLCSADVPEPASRGGVTYKFVEFGDFSASSLQGVEVEVVNSSNANVQCDMQLVLKRKDINGGNVLEVGRIDEKGVALPGHSRKGWRIVEAPIYGECTVEYSVALNGAEWLHERADFVTNGPYLLSLHPAFLGSDGVYVIVEATDLKPARFRFKLLSAGSKVIFETENFRELPNDAPPVQGEPRHLRYGSFISFKNQPPGKYQIVMEALPLQGSKPVAIVTMNLSTEGRNLNVH